MKRPKLRHILERVLTYNKKFGKDFQDALDLLYVQGWINLVELHALQNWVRKTKRKKAP